MGLFKSLIGCFSETAHFEDVAHAVFFYYFHFKDRFSSLNEDQLRCMALLYGAFYDQKHHLGVYHVKYCIAHWVCGDRRIENLDDLVLTFVDGVCGNYYPEDGRRTIDETNYKIKLGKILNEKVKAQNEASSGGGGTLRLGCRNVTLNRLRDLCSDLGYILQRGTVFM